MSVDVEGLAAKVSREALEELKAIAQTRLDLERPTALMVCHRTEGPTGELEPAGLVRWGKAQGFSASFGSVEPTERGWMLVGYLALLDRLRVAEAERDRARQCLLFFCSVIQCGEPWTDTCQRAFDAATRTPETPDAR
ncbi:hypothetical protein [Roseomonas elaeocarpi]|uniref:Uncharacterized protein n=1 Tax=Roseomonas elaeocarpi TaxID=907779 RepID=A0ABV6JT08_9PROT